MIEKRSSALLLVDIRPDFMPAGGLAIEPGERFVAPLRRLIDADRFVHCVATQDRHPAGHLSPASSPARRASP
jgi:nicotinamidase/pyrazinamidase